MGEKMGKKFWKCKVCGDIHFGMAGPEICPTCQTRNSYENTDKEIAKKAMAF